MATRNCIQSNLTLPPSQDMYQTKTNCYTHSTSSTIHCACVHIIDIVHTVHTVHAIATVKLILYILPGSLVPDQVWLDIRASRLIDRQSIGYIQIYTHSTSKYIQIYIYIYTCTLFFSLPRSLSLSIYIHI